MSTFVRIINVKAYAKDKNLFGSVKSVLKRRYLGRLLESPMILTLNDPKITFSLLLRQVLKAIKIVRTTNEPSEFLNMP